MCVFAVAACSAITATHTHILFSLLLKHTADVNMGGSVDWVGKKRPGEGEGYQEAGNAAREGREGSIGRSYIKQKQ